MATNPLVNTRMTLESFASDRSGRQTGGSFTTRTPRCSHHDRPAVRRVPPAGRQGPSLDALHAALDVRHPRRAHHRPRRRGAHLGRQRQQVHRRARRPVRRPGRTRSHRARRGRRQAGRGARLLPALVLRAPGRDRPRRARRGVRTRRPQPRLLHHRWWRGRGDRVEAGQAVLQDDRQAHQAQGDQPRHRLPRHPAGRAVDHRAARDEGAVRAAGALDLPGAEHELLPRDRDLLPRSRGRVRLRPVGGQPDRRGDRVRRSRHRRRGLPRAGAELRRLLPAAPRLLRAGARDLRRVRRAAGLRRGHLRLRPARPHVRRRALRLPARHHHLRQGPHLRATPPSAR